MEGFLPLLPRHICGMVLSYLSQRELACLRFVSRKFEELSLQASTDRYVRYARVRRFSDVKDLVFREETYPGEAKELKEILSDDRASTVKVMDVSKNDWFPTTADMIDDKYNLFERCSSFAKIPETDVWVPQHRLPLCGMTLKWRVCKAFGMTKAYIETVSKKDTNFSCLERVALFFLNTVLFSDNVRLESLYGSSKEEHSRTLKRFGFLSCEEEKIPMDEELGLFLVLHYAPCFFFSGYQYGRDFENDSMVAYPGLIINRWIPYFHCPDWGSGGIRRFCIERSGEVFTCAVKQHFGAFDKTVEVEPKTVISCVCYGWKDFENFMDTVFVTWVTSLRNFDSGFFISALCRKEGFSSFKTGLRLGFPPWKKGHNHMVVLPNMYQDSPFEQENTAKAVLHSKIHRMCQDLAISIKEKDELTQKLDKIRGGVYVFSLGEALKHYEFDVSNLKMPLGQIRAHHLNKLGINPQSERKGDEGNSPFDSFAEKSHFEYSGKCVVSSLSQALFGTC